MMCRFLYHIVESRALERVLFCSWVTVILLMGDYDTSTTGVRILVSNQFLWSDIEDAAGVLNKARCFR